MISLGLFWAFSLIITNLLKVAEEKLDYLLRHAIFNMAYRTIVGVSLLVVSFYTSIVRKLHTDAIKETQTYFAIYLERLNTLTKLKKRLKEIFKFNITTILILCTQRIVDLLVAFPGKETFYLSLPPWYYLYGLSY